jgi:hypothetical protein
LGVKVSAETLNLAEAAEYIKLGYEATKLLFETGVLPGASMNQKHTVFLREDLDAWIRETAKRQAEERRAGGRTQEQATAQARRGRPRRPLPDLDRAERKAAGLAPSSPHP